MLLNLERDRQEVDLHKLCPHFMTKPTPYPKCITLLKSLDCILFILWQMTELAPTLVPLMKFLKLVGFWLKGPWDKVMHRGF